MAKNKILIIEDEPDVAQMMKLIVEDEGYKVDVAIGGKKGMEQVKDGEHDLILLDIRMPDISGREILSFMKKRKIDIPVIVVTAVAASLPVRNELEAKFHINGFVSKPYLSNDLIPTIQKVLRKKKQ